MKDRRIDTHVFTVQPAPGLTVFTAQPAPGYMEAGHARQQRRAGHAPLPAPQLPAAKSGNCAGEHPSPRRTVRGRKLQTICFFQRKIFIFFSRFAFRNVGSPVCPGPSGQHTRRRLGREGRRKRWSRRRRHRGRPAVPRGRGRRVW